MAKILITKERFKRIKKKHLEALLEFSNKAFKDHSEIKLSDSSKILSKAFGFCSEYELQKVFDKSEIKACNGTNLKNGSFEELISEVLALAIDTMQIDKHESGSVCFIYRNGVKLRYADYSDEFITDISEYMIKHSSSQKVISSQSKIFELSVAVCGTVVDIRAFATTSSGSETIFDRLFLKIKNPIKKFSMLDDLGIKNIDAWRSAIFRDNGLCLICGSVGSGKTTVISASLKELEANHREVNNLQRVIVLGEIRDVETAKNAIKLVESGHLVIATLNEPDIYHGMDRLIRLGVSKVELAGSLRSVLALRLVKSICKKCEFYTNVSGPQTESLIGGKLKCPDCLDTRYSGKSIISEVAYFVSEKDVLQCISGGFKFSNLLEEGLANVQAGIVDYSEIADLLRGL